jgi:aryl-alcohol dehydrogenase-like predicted oxidoreductase
MSRANLKHKFIIGTANFTQTYGANPTNVSKNEITKILHLAKKHKINKIDTAEAYLKTNYNFKKIEKTFKFSSKIIADSRWTSLEFCQKKLQNHIKSFSGKQLETLLFHDTKILFTQKGDKIFKNLELLKSKKYFHKIGLSIYDTNYLSTLISKYNFDVVQCPYNILDKRILTTGWFDKLKNEGKEIHIRSIFLQGLLVNPMIYKKKYFRKWKKFFFDWFQYLKVKNIKPIDYCLSDLLEHDFDKIIIGINNSKNLNEIINFKTVNKNKMINFKINDTKLIDPRNWK